MVSRARRERRFGVNLAAPHPVHPSELLASRAGLGGVFPRATPFASVPGFAQALRDSIQNWSDNTQVTSAGTPTGSSRSGCAQERAASSCR